MKELNTHMFENVYKELDINIDKLGCVMLDIEPLESMYSIELDGAGVALYYAKNPERKWIKGWVIGKTAHVTLLYGLLQNAHIIEQQVLQVLNDWNIDEVEIGDISFVNNITECSNSQLRQLSRQ